MSRNVIVGFTTSLVMVWGLPVVGAEDEKREPPSISVSGRGKISAVPDIAEVHVGVTTQAATAQQALAANNQAMERLHSILKERGVAAKDIQTTQIQVLPQHSQPQPGAQSQEFVPRLVGYRVENSVQVTARQVSKLGSLLDALVEAGANQVHGISFRVGEADKLMDEARRRAMSDAKRKAELLAGEAGVVLGLPRQIVEEGGSWFPPGPHAPRAPMAMMAAPAPMPVAPGEQELSVSVHVVYELKPAK